MTTLATRTAYFPTTYEGPTDMDAERVFAHANSRNSVAPLHRGHHPVWENGRYHVDICNMVDDVVAGDHETGSVYRFPITPELMPWLTELIVAMDTEDDVPGASRSKRMHNLTVRALIMSAVKARLRDVPLPLHIFEPGCVLKSDNLPAEQSVVGMMLGTMIAENPDTLVR